MDDIEEVVTELGLNIASVGHEISAHCPFHSDSHPSFSINAKSGLWICYQCGRAGNFNMLVEQVGGRGVAQSTDLLREIKRRHVGRKRPEPEAEPEPPDPLFIFARYEDFRWPPKWAWHERRIKGEVIEQYGLKWDRGWIIPIWAPEMTDEWTGLWGWQFKRLDYVSNYPKQVKKSRTLFGLRELDSTKSVALVESPLDVARLASVGVSAVAAYGAFVSLTQLRLLIEVADSIVLALDGDFEGERQMHKIYRFLAKQVPTRRVSYPAGCKDPGDLNDQQARRVFDVEAKV
jgi:hypothetical protein